MNKLMVRAARAAANPTITGRHGTVMPLVGEASRSYVGRNRSAARRTAAQRDSAGRISDWSRSPYAPKGGWR